VVVDERAQTFEGDDDSGGFSFDTPEGEGSLSFDLNGDGVVSEGEGGSFTVTGRTPDGWPHGFPVPEDATVQGGNVVEAGELTQLTTHYRVDRSPSEVLAFYEAALAGPATWTEIRNADEEAYDASVSFDGDYVGFLVVRTGTDGTEVAVQLQFS
jgi:hypothetical protein